MGSDRKIGIGILSVMAAIGLLILFGYFFGIEAIGIALGILFVATIFYIGLIATIYDTDPMVWTGKKIGEWLDKLKEN